MVEGTRLESVRALIGYRGFESLPLRHPSLASLRAQRRMPRRSWFQTSKNIHDPISKLRLGRPAKSKRRRAKPTQVNNFASDSQGIRLESGEVHTDQRIMVQYLHYLENAASNLSRILSPSFADPFLASALNRTSVLN